MVQPATQITNKQIVANEMAKFNLFRLSCMLDDTDGTKFNKVLVSVICDYIYQRDNEKTSLNECYNYVVRELGITTTKQQIKNVVAKVDYLHTEHLKDEVLIFLEVSLYDNICHTSDANAIEFHAKYFVKHKSLSEIKADILVTMIHQSIYENIQGIAGGNIKLLLSEGIKEKFPVEDVILFNQFLDFESRSKDNAIFKLFYKALEFAIVTSGKGVKDFAANLFKGKIYLLDTNVIFRMMGIDGVQEQANMEELIDACLHQGVEFRYTHQTYDELKRKREQAVAVLKRFNNNVNQLVEETIIDGDIDIQEGFANQYYRYKKIGIISTPEQYELKLMAEFRRFEDIYNLKPVSNNIKVDKREAEVLAQDLFEEKKTRRARRYTGSAAQVDAYNVLCVRMLRSYNNISFSDVKCFYLSTDWTLSEILKTEINGQGVSEVLSPAQAFLLHSSLSANVRDVDFITFTKFLKKNVIGQEFTGVEIVRYVNQISNLTTNPATISTLLKAYSDKRYSNGRNYEADFELPTFKEFAKTELEAKLEAARLKAEDAERTKNTELESVRKATQDAAEKAEQEIISVANERNAVVSQRDNIFETLNTTMQTSIKRHLRASLIRSKIIEVVLAIFLTSAGLLIKDKVHNSVLIIGVLIVVFTKLADVFFSSKMGIMKRIWRWLFHVKLRSSDIYRSEATREQYVSAAIVAFDKVSNNNLWSVKLK